MLDVPCGQSYFPTIRRDRLVYVDKTRFIRDLEAPGRSFVVFLRPRRFGKSTLLSTLQHYYDRNQAQQFEAPFGGLDIGAAPTPRRNSYLTLRLEYRHRHRRLAGGPSPQRLTVRSFIPEGSA